MNSKDKAMLDRVDMAQAALDDMLDMLDSYHSGDVPVEIKYGSMKVTLAPISLGQALLSLRAYLVENIRARDALEHEMRSRGVRVCQSDV